MTCEANEVLGWQIKTKQNAHKKKQKHRPTGKQIKIKPKAKQKQKQQVQLQSRRSGSRNGDAGEKVSAWQKY